MTVTITLPQTLETQLKQKAQTHHLSLEEMVLDILGNAVRPETSLPTPKNVVAKIQALPSNPKNLRTASGSLADALRQAPTDPEFNLEQWQEEWSNVETEMRQIAKENSIAEGRA